jgi:hypothetical protein
MGGSVDDGPTVEDAVQAYYLVGRVEAELAACLDLAAMADDCFQEDSGVVGSVAGDSVVEDLAVTADYRGSVYPDLVAPAVSAGGRCYRRPDALYQAAAVVLPYPEQVVFVERCDPAGPVQTKDR